MKWLLVAIMVGATTAGEVLQAAGMRRHGEIHDFRPGAIGRALAMLARNRFVIGSAVCMAISFFAFMKLLSVTRTQLRGPGLGGIVRDGDGAGQICSERAGQPAALGGRIAGDRRRPAGLHVIWLAIPALAAAAYYCLAIVAAAHLARPAPRPPVAPLPAQLRRSPFSNPCTDAIRSSTKPSSPTPRRTTPSSRFSSAPTIPKIPAFPIFAACSANSPDAASKS